MFANGTILGFGTPIDINVTFNDADQRKRVAVSKFNEDSGKQETQVLYLFTDGEDVQGQVIVAIPPGRKVEYNELKCELVGQLVIEGNAQEVMDFAYRETTLGGCGSIETSSVFDYCFDSVEKPHESYNGICAHLRYFIRVTLTRSYAPTVIEVQEFWVQNVKKESEINSSIKMEVGIEDCLHIEFEYNKSKYHLNDVVLGKVFFLLVQIKVKHMELAIVRRETTGSGATIYTESETVARFEVMDGNPSKGESVPVRLFLGGFRLTPTYTHVERKFSTKYYLNLVLVDEEDRKYYKQQEIVLWRKHL